MLVKILCDLDPYVNVKGQIMYFLVNVSPQVRIQRGDRGSGPPPPGKSQVIWVSIGNNNLMSKKIITIYAHKISLSGSMN